MMKMRKLFPILTAISLTLVLSAAAFAQERPRTPRIRERQENQQQRIGQGVRSGELTSRETVRLEREQRGIQREKRAAKADGVVTRAERREIRHDQNRASRDVYRAKHNRRDRH
ncbi:MAG TPA: hypothetical protein VJ302_08520 [Blastocatellia bacterium]|nr:hypothetical protein [Blastocatellia bacterium]